MATLMQRPDDLIFASKGLTGEVTDFPNIERGWGQTLVNSQGIPPMEWFNFVGQRVDKGIHYVLQQGVDIWVASENYTNGSLVKVVADNCLYRALSNNTNKPPINNSDVWKKVLDITEASAAARKVGADVGNVVTVGAFGVGSTAEQYTDANQIPAKSGFYKIPANGANASTPGQPCDILQLVFDANNIIQYGNAVNNRTIKIRLKVNGSWNTWEGIYSPSNKPTAQELGINQDFIPLSGSDQVTGNIGTTGWIHIARTTSDLLRLTNSSGVAVSETVGNVAGGQAVQQRMTSVSVSAGSNMQLMGFWGTVCMSDLTFQLNSGGSTQAILAVCRAGGISDRRVDAFAVDGNTSRVETRNGFTLWEAGQRVYSPNNPQPVDLSSVVNSVRLGGEVRNNRNGGESFVLRMPSGHVATGFDIHSKGGREDEFNAVFSRPIQYLINNNWYTVAQA